MTSILLDETALVVPQARPSLSRGSLVSGFCVGEKLGEGAMGTVYEARDFRSGAFGAIKVTAISSRAERARFQRSILARRDVTHSSILPVWNHGLREGLGYVVTPRLQAAALSARIDRERGHDFDYVADLMAPLASALGCLHEHGWVHRDFKPANVLFAKAGTPILVDYGLVKRHVRTSEDEELEEVTQPGGICGTPYYMSSQRLEGALASPSDDVYAFALAVVELLTGRLPASAGGRTIFTLAQRRRSGLRLPKLNCPSSIRRLIEAGLSPNATARPPLEDFEVLLS